MSKRTRQPFTAEAATQLARSLLDPEQSSPALETLRTALLKKKKTSTLQDSVTALLEEDAEAATAPELPLGPRVLRNGDDEPIAVYNLAELSAPDVEWVGRHGKRGKRCGNGKLFADTFLESHGVDCSSWAGRPRAN